MMKILPGDVKTAQLHSFLLGAVAPRPICFASTIDANGNANLSPFSFFNVFSARPPILIFSPARRVRNNTGKDTLQNAIDTKEVVINVVNHAIVQQMNLASCEYPTDVDEFKKAGFTQLPSELVKPFRVKESPVQIECKVLQVTPLGTEGGAGNLVICEVLCMHIDEHVLNEAGQIDPHKIDLVARMGGDYYCRASGSSIFEVPKPNASLGIGVDQLPAHIRHSEILTGNHLGVLANYSSIPVITDLQSDIRLTEILKVHTHNAENRLSALHTYARELLNAGEPDRAWQVLLVA